jgi:Tol biopolymer transport system component
MPDPVLFSFARAVSPDERHIAFVTPTQDLAIHDLSSGQTATLVSADREAGESAQFPSFAPDGRQLAYSWAARGRPMELRVVQAAAAGTAPRTIFAGEDVGEIYAYDWSPDGTRLLVLCARRDRTLQIALVSVADGRLTPLTSTMWRRPGHMEFSPDGRYIAVDLPASTETTNRDVYVFAVDGSVERVVASGHTRDVFAGWSPDGAHVLFESNREGSSGLWAVPVTEGRATGAPVRVMGDMGAFSPLGVTPSGRFYYRLRELPREIVKIGTVDFANDRLVEPFAELPATPRGYTTHTPDFSPDGRFIAMLSVDHRFAGEFPIVSPRIVIREVTSGRIHRDFGVEPELEVITHLRWAPDGRHLAAAGRTLRGRYGIFLIDTDTGQISTVVLADPGPATVSRPEWSADGRCLYFYRRVTSGNVTEHQVVERTLSTGEERPLLRSESGVYGPTASPDHSMLAASLPNRSDEAAPSLAVISTSGGDVRRLWPRVGRSDVVGWLPDGLSVLMSIDGGRGSRELWRVPVGGGETAPFNSQLLGHPGTARLHPDGRRVAIEDRQNMAIPAPDEIWVLENFLPRRGR